MNRLPLVPTMAAAVLSCATATATDWILAPSYYSHDPQTGERVTQYKPVAPVLVEVRPDHVRSGYRHTQSRIQVGGSADYLHVTEEWGRPVRPYGEWEFPYRPYSVPYDAWGPPFGGLENRRTPYGPWGAGAGPYGYGASPHQFDDRRNGYDEGHRGRDRRGDREHRPLPGDDGYPGRFFDRPTTDHEFFWPRPRDPGRRGVPPQKKPRADHTGGGEDQANTAD